jgi:LacI family transcriptional regulator
LGKGPSGNGSKARGPYKVVSTIRIGALVPELGNSFFGKVLGGIEQVAYDANSVTQVSATLYQPQREREMFSRLLAQEVSGLILWPCRGDLDHCKDVFRPEVPVVTVDRSVQCDGYSIGSVVFDDLDGATKVAEYLLNLGHRRIAFMAPDPIFASFSTTQMRIAGLKAAIEKRGLDSNLLTVEHCQKGEDYAYSTCMQLFCGETPPTAVFLNDDSMAPAVYSVFRRLGLKVGQDVAVVGFGDQEVCTQLEVPLTSVRQNMSLLGKRAMEMLLEKLRNPLYKMEKIVLPAPLIIRSSCCPPAESKG